MKKKKLFITTLFLKASLGVAVLYMLAFPDQPQFEAKSMTLRAILYPIFASIFFIYYLLKKPGEYPYYLDIPWTFTFTIDIIGNDLNLYNSYKDFDDFIHFINGVPFIWVIYHLIKKTGLKSQFWGIFLSLTLYIIFHSMWEYWEYWMDENFGTYLLPGGFREALENTLATTAGAVLGIFAILWFARK